MVHSGTHGEACVKVYIMCHTHNDVSSVWQVIESSKRWWKVRNRFNQIGFVPFNILEPVAHIDSPVTNSPPSVRHKKLTHMRTHATDTSAEVLSHLQENLSCLLSDPPGSSPAAPRQDFHHNPTQPSCSIPGPLSLPLPLPAAPAQLTSIQPPYTISRWNR